MNKRNLFLWSLYDFANSFVFINFLLYFSQWLVIDGGLSDFWYNATFAIATLILLFSAPRLASYTDKWGNRKLFLIIATIGTAVCYGLSAWFAAIGLGMTIIVVAFILGQYFYQLSFVFYNPLVKDIADEKHYTRAFGIGQFSNSLGQVAGLLATLPLIATSRLAPLLPSVLMFVVLALPMIIWFKESKKQPSAPIKAIASSGFIPLSKRKIVLFFTTGVAAPMIISFFFFNDASLTVSNNFGIFLEKIFGVADNIKSILLILIVIMAAIGGIVSGWIGDRVGQLKTLKGVYIGRIVCLFLLAITTNFVVFSIILVLTGSLVGAGWAVSRGYLTSLLKKDELGYGFAFYALSERFATFLGPLTWGAIVGYYAQSALGYRYAMAFMIVYMIIALLILVIKKPTSSKK